VPALGSKVLHRLSPYKAEFTFFHIFNFVRHASWTLHVLRLKEDKGVIATVQEEDARKRISKPRKKRGPTHKKVC
jgi:hypothetical protein